MGAGDQLRRIFAETQSRDDKDLSLVTEYCESKREIKIAFQISSLGDWKNHGGTTE